jgi:hypothetical protein
MDGIIWLFLLQAVALIVLAVVLMSRRGRASGVDPNLGHCSSCRTPISMRRVSLAQSLMLRGAWVCPHCGTRMTRARKRAGTAS